MNGTQNNDQIQRNSQGRYAKVLAYKTRQSCPGGKEHGLNTQGRGRQTLFDHMSFVPYIKEDSWAAFLNLHNTMKIRNIRFQDDAKEIVHAFLNSRLDFCNSLLSECPNKSLKGFQLIENSAA